MDPIRRTAKIKHDLYLAGYTFPDVDRQNDLPRGAAYRAMSEPNEKAEVALAAALACEPQDLWPERYDASGQRLKPQPPANYERPQSARQRRIEAGISTC